MILPLESRIGAALSSMAKSCPPLLINTVWLASPTTWFRAANLVHRILHGFAGFLVYDSKDFGERFADGFLRISIPSILQRQDSLT